MTGKFYRSGHLGYSAFLGILLGFALSFGQRLEKDGEIIYSDYKLYLLWLFLSVVAIGMYEILWVILRKCKERKASGSEIAAFGRKQWLGVFCILAASYTITFLAVFPGFFAYDALMAYRQVFYRSLTSQHPWLHTFALGYVCQFAMSHLGHANVGIAIYIYLQMLLVAGCFTYVLYTIRKRIESKFLFWLALLFYAAMPTIHMFALCSTKDTLFTALMLLLVTLLFEMLEDSDAFFASGKRQVIFCIALLGFLIMRKNAFYAFLLFVPFFLIFLKKNAWKGALLVGVSMLAFWVYDVPLTRALGVIDIGPQEALSVPSQQLARVYTQNRESLEEGEAEQIRKFYPKEYFEMYLPKLADYSKAALDRDYFADHLPEYIKLWLSVGVKNPDMYADSFLVNTYGYWYPFASLDGYKGYAGIEGTPIENAEVFYFAYETESPGERHSLIPALDRFYFRLSTTKIYRCVPVISLLFSPGFMFWVYLSAFAYSVMKREKAYYLPFLLMGFVWLSVQFGPIALVRYVLFLFFAFPFFISVFFRKERRV